MAIVNVTPDSFFDGGRCSELGPALERAWEVVADGADILDIGGESSRPGAEVVEEAEERRRVLPLIEALVNGNRPYPLPISIDTTSASVADAALQSGACIVNDITGGTRDPRILDVCAEHGAGIILMHMRGTPRTMQDDVSYNDLVGEVTSHLEQCCRAATRAGIPAAHQAVDPGIGFGKSAAGCLEILGRLHALAALERPVLIGASRKSFLGRAFGHEGDERLMGSAMAAGLAIHQGASIVRVHDVRATRLAVDVASGVRRAGAGSRGA
ncbi:MAG: dihydropteroate synthase [Deltaproteobacteria bacterium]|nr:dihydropteroate synthase [Deltaproteobacteria bacterium]